MPNGIAGSVTLKGNPGARLSELTGDPEYTSLVELAESYLLDPKPAWAEPYDGLVGSNINITTGEFADATVSWSGGADSFYEYLLKMYVYDSERFALYGDRYDRTPSTRVHLSFTETISAAGKPPQNRQWRFSSLRPGRTSWFSWQNLAMANSSSTHSISPVSMVVASFSEARYSTTKLISTPV